MIHSSKFAGIALLASLSLSAGATQLIANGDFQDGTYAPWVQSGTAFVLGNWAGSDFGVLGNQYAYFGGYANASESLSQMVDFGAAPGTAVLSFDFQTNGQDFSNFDFLRIFVGGATVAELDMSPNGSVGLSTVTRKSYDVSAFVGTGMKDLLFRGTTDISLPSAAFVDNISLDVRPVPEPATLTALGCGIVALFRRRKSA